MSVRPSVGPSVCPSVSIKKNAVYRVLGASYVGYPALFKSDPSEPSFLPGGDSVSFEVLGFDVLLDEKLRPWLLEVNRSPSFATDEKIDNEIKSGLLTDTLR